MPDLCLPFSLAHVRHSLTYGACIVRHRWFGVIVAAQASASELTFEVDGAHTRGGFDACFILRLSLSERFRGHVNSNQLGQLESKAALLILQIPALRFQQ